MKRPGNKRRRCSWLRSFVQARCRANTFPTISAIALLPVLGRWFDPAPVQDPNARAGTLSVLLDVLGSVSHRAWGLPVIVALSACVVTLTATAYATLAYRGVPWPRRNHVLWPLLGLGVALAICSLLDEHLPEFGR